MIDLKKRCWMIMVFALTVTLLSCERETSNTVISVGSIVDSIVEEEAEEKEAIVLSEKEIFEKKYGDGAYLEDFSATLERLNKEATIYYEDYFSEVLDKDDILLIELDMYYTFLRKVRDENISYNEIVENYEEYIDKVNILCISFYDDSLKYSAQEIEELSSYKQFYLDFIYEETYGKEYFSTIVYSLNSNLMKSVRELSKTNMKSEELINVLYDLNGDYIFAYCNENGSDGIYADDLRDIKEFTKILSKKYFESFIPLPTHGTRHMFASKSNTSLIFEMDPVQDRYVSVFAEDYIYKNVEAIIDKYDAQDNIGTFVAVDASTMQPFNMPNYIDNEEELIDQVMTFLTFYYVVEPGESYDLEMLRNIMYESRKYLPEDNSLVTIYVKLYYAEEDERLTFLKLMRENPLTENYIRDGSMGSNWEISGNDSVAFRYLYCFLEKEEYMYKSVGFVRLEMDVDEYFLTLKAVNEYKDWENE